MKLLKYTTKVGTGTCNLLKVLADPKFGMLLTALNPNKGADDEIEVTFYFQDEDAERIGNVSEEEWQNIINL